MNSPARRCSTKSGIGSLAMGLMVAGWLAGAGSFRVSAEPGPDRITWLELSPARLEGVKLSGKVGLLPMGRPTGEVAARWQGEGTLVAPRFWSADGIEGSSAENLVIELLVDQGEDGLLQLALMEPDGVASFVRAIRVAAGEWTQIEVPLRWMRWGAGRVPLWEKVRALGLEFEGEGLRIRRLGIRHGRRGALPDAAEMIRLAFADLKVDRYDENGLQIWSAAAEVDVGRLARHLARARRSVLKEWGLPAEPLTGRVPVLLVFPDREAYRDFVPRYAEALGGVALRPDSGGYHLQGWALSYYDARHGSLRPVFTHEFAHAVVAHHGLIAGHRSEWLHEGIAVRLQSRFHPQDNLGDIIRDGIRNSALPLRRLCNGEALELHHYWQAMTVIDWLIDGGRVDLASRRRLLDAVRRRGDTALGPHLEPVLGTDWSRLEGDWRAWTRRRHR